MRNVGNAGGLSWWRWVAAVGFVFATAGVARAADTPFDPRGGRDQEVLTQVHQQNQNLIAAAQVAQQRAASPAAKDYAARVIAERQAADEKLMAYAQQEGMNVSEIQTAAGALPHGPLATARLTNVSADRFDPYFAAEMVAREQAAVDVATKAETLVRGPRLAALLRETVPGLLQEQADAMQLSATLPPLQAPAVQMPGEPPVVSWTPPAAPR
jgi:predicted outer membrane protein